MFSIFAPVVQIDAVLGIEPLQDTAVERRDSPPSSRPSVRHFCTAAVGVSFANSDGSERQEIISRCRQYESLDLDHEEANPHDANAIRLLRENGEQIGYLARHLAKEHARFVARGYRYAAFIKNITGDTRDGQTLGVNIVVILAPPGATDADAQKYLDRLVANGIDRLWPVHAAGVAGAGPE